MKALFQKYKSVVRFVVLFLGTYLLFSFLYSLYIDFSKGGAYPPDFITYLVAKQSGIIISEFGYNAEIIPHDAKPMMNLYINKQYLASIIEGCNAVSVIILFVTFVVAFAEKWKKTVVFLLTGAVLIYAMNILRIVILSIAIYHYPQHTEILHGVVFPGLIYGMVFILWMIWVKILSRKTETNNE